MSDIRGLLNPPSAAPAGAPLEALLNPIPGRVRPPEDTRHEEAEDDSFRGFRSRQEKRVHRAA